MKLLEGKVAIVTGAARGIGEAIAIKFAEHGANVAFTYVSDSSTEKATTLRLLGPLVRTVPDADAHHRGDRQGIRGQGQGRQAQHRRASQRPRALPDLRDPHDFVLQRRQDGRAARRRAVQGRHQEAPRRPARLSRLLKERNRRPAVS